MGRHAVELARKLRQLIAAAELLPVANPHAEVSIREPARGAAERADWTGDLPGEHPADDAPGQQQRSEPHPHLPWRRLQQPAQRTRPFPDHDVLPAGIADHAARLDGPLVSRPAGLVVSGPGARGQVWRDAHRPGTRDQVALDRVQPDVESALAAEGLNGFLRLRGAVPFVGVGGVGAQLGHRRPADDAPRGKGVRLSRHQREGKHHDEAARPDPEPEKDTQKEPAHLRNPWADGGCARTRSRCCGRSGSCRCRRRTAPASSGGC